ncbi:MAG: transcriptional repressor [Candidatus Zixiibacteriota bacterium]|nr:MAG: transcriptional repressor [candidate division Zixibacteria bacterium]
MKKERGILANYLKQKGLKHTSQRFFILDKFLASKRHLSADELHAIVREQNPKIGFSTVYRTLRILAECGLAREVNFGDGRARFEKGVDKSQHGHLVCANCGKTEEFSISAIEKSIEKIATRYGFKVKSYRIKVFGLCKKCR